MSVNLGFLSAVKTDLRSGFCSGFVFFCSPLPPLCFTTCLAHWSSGSPVWWCLYQLALRTSSTSCYAMLTRPLWKFWEGWWFWRVTGATTVLTVSSCEQEVSCQALAVIGGLSWWVWPLLIFLHPLTATRLPRLSP